MCFYLLLKYYFWLLKLDFAVCSFKFFNYVWFYFIVVIYMYIILFIVQIRGSHWYYQLDFWDSLFQSNMSILVLLCARKKSPHITCIDLMQKILCFLCFLLLLMWIFSNKCTNYQNCLPLFKKWILGEQIHEPDPYFDIRYNLYQVRWRTWIKVLKNIFIQLTK